MTKFMINIHSQPALVGLETKVAQAPVRTRLASFSLESEPSKLEMTTHYSKIRIDSSSGRAEVGLMNIGHLSRCLASQGLRESLNGIGRRSEQGDRLADFWEPGNKVEDMAAQDAAALPLEIFSASPNPVAVEIDPGQVVIDYHPGKLATQLGKSPDPNAYEPGYVRVFLRQRAEMEITWRRLDVFV